MGLIQVREFTTSSYDEVNRLHETWLTETEGERTVQSERICKDRDKPDAYVIVVEFVSYDEAMKNNDLPATARIAEGMAAVSDGPPAFRNLDVIRSD